MVSARGLAEVAEDIRQKTGKIPKIVVTDARRYPESIGFDGLKKE